MYDTLVVGGGPQGWWRPCTLLVFGGRSDRRAGGSRALKIPRSHNYPGFARGIAGSDLTKSLREQAAAYEIATSAGCVTSLEREGDGFRTRWECGVATARSVLLATGACDVEPEMPHVADALRTGALRYCPVCDGFEVIGQHVGVLIGGPQGVREALYLRHFTDRLTAFRVSETVQLTPDDAQALSAAGIKSVAATVRSVRLWGWPGHDQSWRRRDDLRHSL